jgi:hypothetical protein
MNDLILEFVWLIVLLIMMFVFIFVGIAAFSPVTTFSGVMNSILIAFSGLFANTRGHDEEKEVSETEASNAANEIVSEE